MAVQRVEGLSVEHEGPVLRLRLDRPERRNALTDEIVAGLIAAIDEAESDELVRVISLSGNGEHFCSGFDLATRAPRGSERPRVGSIQRRMRRQVNRLIPSMLECQTPIVAAAQGWAVGLGLNLVLAADFAVVADDARLWAPFTELGFTPDSGASWLLPRLVGVARAKEIVLLGRKVEGRQAASWGLVHRSVPADQLEATAEDLIGELASSATVALGQAKLLMHRGLTADVHRHLAEEGWAMEVSSRSEDFAEHHRARREDRDPELRGR